MDKIIWLIGDDWYAGEKASSDSVGPYIYAADLRKLVEIWKEAADEHPTTRMDCGQCADDLEQLLKRGE